MHIRPHSNCGRVVDHDAQLEETHNTFYNINTYRSTLHFNFFNFYTFSNIVFAVVFTIISYLCLRPVNAVFVVCLQKLNRGTLCLPIHVSCVHVFVFTLCLPTFCRVFVFACLR